MDTSSQPVKNRRSAERFPLAWTVILPRGEARTRDISLAGVYLETSDLAADRLETDQPPAPGEAIRFVLRSPDPLQARDLWCEGRVVRVETRDNGFGAGVVLEGFRFGA